MTASGSGGMASDIAVIRTTVLEIQKDLTSILETMQAHNGRLRALEVGHATLSAEQASICKDVNTRLGIFGGLATVFSMLAGIVAGLIGK